MTVSRQCAVISLSFIPACVNASGLRRFVPSLRRSTGFIPAFVNDLMYNTPIAYFLTFTIRGSWRHGDARGSWKRDGQFVAPNSIVNAAPNKNPPHYFCEEECRIIENSMEEVCAARQWILHEKSIVNNHVHVVVTAPDITPENVMKLLKAKATMRLRKGGFVGLEKKIWTQHGSTKYVFDEKGLQTVYHIRFVVKGNRARSISKENESRERNEVEQPDP